MFENNILYRNYLTNSIFVNLKNLETKINKRDKLLDILMLLL